MKRGVIYKATNQITGEAYIGITTNSIRQRKLDHTERALRGEPGKFYEAIATYGSEAFAWQQIDSTYNNDELAAKEKEYILTFNTQEEGYNTDAGGGIEKTVYQFKLDSLELINAFPNLQSAANMVNATKQDISRACLSANGELQGFYWSYNKSDIFTPKGDLRRKRVSQLDLNGCFLAEFNSVAQASRKIGLSRTCIARVCRGERESSGGFKWQYAVDDEN
ncbi:endonuclease [Salegentibacter mishustinae]|jgi:group I intron endonuclease|uniref:NUMOD1 domain-containing DNA-binding protein n=1 Tax=Salegentibacter mishustinae TaxID=270918 RepID=UPI001CE03263|nr:NUMOD1 domain-containing DNA-binding protein [Salegentibacter mishustinae]UBZ08269.1 endonuclease [Salegentibacter mishustinae]